MKRVILFAISLCFALFLNAQVSKTVNVTAGGLSSSLTATELSTVTNLTLTGTIDARDFKIMRDEMPVLAVLDLSQVTIQAYSGTEGTEAVPADYAANELPRYSFCKITSGMAQGKWSLTSVIFPNNITSIGKNALGGCFYLMGNLVIPNSVTTIGDYAFDACFGLAGTLTLSNNLVSIGRGAFSNCWDMTGSLTIPNSVTTIGSNAFSGCSRLDGTLTLPPNLTSISDSAFYSCSRLTGNLSIPATVSSIGSFAFSNCGGFTSSLVLPANLTSLGSYAFYGSKFTGTLTIPTSITEIKDGTFAFGLGYSSVVFPPLLTKIGKSAFESCSAWTGVLSLPATVSSIGDVAFSSCSKLTGVIFPETLTSIGSSAFSGCIGLQGTLTIPNSVSTIGETAFQSCTGLTAVNLPSTFVTIPYGLFKYCSGLSGKFILPESTTSIGFAAFASCTALNSINIPGSVTAIYQAAFSKCTSLTSIWNYCQIPVNLSSAPYVFENVNQAACILYVPIGTKAAYQSANKWKDFTNIVEMPSLTLSASTASLAAALGNNASVELTSNTDWTANSDQTWLTVSPTSGNGNQTLTFTAEINLVESARTATVTITATGLAPQTVSVTQQAMVKGAKIVNVTAGGLKTVLTADELVSITNLTLTGTIDARDFKTMRDDMPLLAVLDLSKVTIVAYIGTEGTANNINYSANTIPESAFLNSNSEGKISLTSVILPEGLTSIEPYSFEYCRNLTTISIPSLVTAIGDYAFDGCSGLTGTLTIPSFVTSIGSFAFSTCRNLTFVNIPPSVTSIGDGAFRNNSCLIIVDADNIKYSSIDGLLFNKDQTSLLYCSNSLKGSSVIPSTVTTIGDYAFELCSDMTAVSFPLGLTSIGNYAFHGCGGLTSVVFPNELISFGDHAFFMCWNLTSLSIPSSVTTIQGNAFGCFNLNSITANSNIPVDLSSSTDVFILIDKTACTLYVPYATKAAYQAANQWKDFTNIVEMPGFKLSATTANVAANQGSTTSVELTSNTAWTVNSDQKWLTVSPKSGTGNQTLTFTADANPLATTRAATVTVSSDGLESKILSVTQEGIFETQSIALSIGWNIISANVIPSNVNMKDIFQSLIDAGSLKKVMDEAGKTIENFGAFGGWKNNIGNLNTTKGYKVNMTAASTLSLEGTPVPLPLDIPLNIGWNIISYPSASTQDAKALVQTLIDAGKLKKVMDETGKTIENFGAFGGWKNNIGNLSPGKGYKVNVTTNCILTIPATGTKSAVVLPELLASEHFRPIFTGNGTDHSSINLIDLQASGLLAGDEIGVFDGELCVGSAMIGTEQLRTGSISIPASANDELDETENGFISGHSVQLQLYRIGQTYKLNIEKLSGNELFEKNGSLFATVSLNELTTIQITDDSAQFKCYPNPFTSEITIEVQNLSQAEVTVEIYNLAGQLIKNLFKGMNDTYLILKWNGTNDSDQQVAPGVYLCKVNGMVKQVIFD